jgi:ribonuclease BN (tRNA processing enzyme)
MPETSILLDCGAAASRFLLKKKFNPDVPGVLWLSHMHSDHNGQVSALIQSLWLRTRRATLHVVGPAEVLSAMKDWLEKCILFPELIGFPIEWHAVKPGKPLKLGAVTLTAFATEHLDNLASHFKKAYPNTCFDCYGAIIEYEGKQYVYSSDLAHPRELIPALKERQVTGLLCELTHFSDRDLFQQIAQHSVQAIWLTHYPDHFVRREQELQGTAREEKFRGEVHLMYDRVAHEI